MLWLYGTVAETRPDPSAIRRALSWFVTPPVAVETDVGTSRGVAGTPYTAICWPCPSSSGFGPAQISMPPFGTYTWLSPPKMNWTPGSVGSQSPPGSSALGWRGKVGWSWVVRTNRAPSRRAVGYGDPWFH